MDQVSEARRILDALEASGVYVFHGAGQLHTRIVPKQATVDRDGRKLPDGPPALFASSRADYAVFMAIVNDENCPKGFRSGVGRNHAPDGTLSMDFRIDPNGFAQLTDESRGFVYVFHSSDFVHRAPGDVEYVAYEPRTPLQVIEVRRRDMPQNIRISLE